MLLTSSKRVLANWPAKMSHSPHGECDFDSQGTDETTGSQQPDGRAHDVGSGGHADVCQRQAYEAYAGGVPRNESCRSPHSHRGHRAPDATPEAVLAEVVHLVGTRYPGANYTHLSELLSEREGIDIGKTTLKCILVNAGLKSPRRSRSGQAPGTSPANASREDADPGGRQLPSVIGGPGSAIHAADCRR